MPPCNRRQRLPSTIRSNWPLPPDFDGLQFDLVLLDYRLGDEDGLQYLRRFRRVPKFPPVIMLTGAGNERLAVEAIKQGATDYISKLEMSHAVLTRAMEEALDARGAVERFQDDRAAPAIRCSAFRCKFRSTTRP